MMFCLIMMRRTPYNASFKNNLKVYCSNNQHPYNLVTEMPLWYISETKTGRKMEKKYEVGGDFFREQIIAAIFYGFRTVKNPASVTVHPELMARIRDDFKNKVVAPKNVGDAEFFFGLPVIEDATKEKDHISVK